MSLPLKILYVGPLWEGTTCLQRMKALQDLGHSVMGIDTEPHAVRIKQRSIFHRIGPKLFRLGFNAFSPKI